MAVTMKNGFLAVMLCSQLEIFHFRGTCCLRLDERRIPWRQQVPWKWTISSPLHSMATQMTELIHYINCILEQRLVNKMLQHFIYILNFSEKFYLFLCSSLTCWQNIDGIFSIIRISGPLFWKHSFFSVLNNFIESLMECT